jgi:hypothetical protein
MSKIVIDHNSDNERLRIGWILDGKREEFAWFVNRYSQQVIDFTSRMLSNAKNAYGIYSWPETVVISPDGTIVASPSTTEALEAELKKIYGSNRQ